MQDDHASTKGFYAAAHRLAIFSGVTHLLICIGIAVFTSTWLMVYFVGVPAIAVPTVLALRYPDSRLSRLAMAIGFMMLTGLVIQQTGGDLEAHFSFFVMLSVLVIYCDWCCIVAAVATILLHHLIFNILQAAGLGFYVWNDHRGGWDHFLIHVVVGALQGGALIYIAMMLRQRMVLQIKNAALDRSLKALGEEASRDVLTGLYNRRHLNSLIGEIDVKVSSGKQTAVLLNLDLDHFKAINDNYGHPAGDIVLKAVAQTIQVGLVSPDCAVRQGGEEFILVLQGRSPAEGLDIAEAIRQRIASSSIKVDHNEIVVTVSIGLAVWRQNESFHDCYARADRALYLAKSSGRNRVESDTHGRLQAAA